MKKIFTLLALTISFSMNAQWEHNTDSWGIQSSTNNASGYYSTAMGYTQQQVDMILQQWEIGTTASGIILQQWEIHNSK